MKNKAFTLAELIAVIVILALISLVTIPTITKILNDNREKLCKTQLEQILVAAKNYGAENIFRLPEEDGQIKIITLENLISEGFIDGDIQNPVTKEYFDKNIEVKIKKNNKKYEYTIDSEVYLLCKGD